MLLKPWMRLGLPIAILALVGGLTLANYQFALASPGGNDFLARWNAANMWLRQGFNPYAPEVSLRAQQFIYGRPADISVGEDLAHFVYPMPSMVFFAPFGLLPYLEARALWMTVLEIGLAALGVMALAVAGWRPSMALTVAVPVFSVLWYCGIRAVIVGQFAVVEALLLIGALLAIQGRRDVLAGILLALSICKPQMSFLLIPFVVVWTAHARRWSVLVAFAGVTFTMLALSFALVPSWVIDWLRQLVDYPGYAVLGSTVSIAAMTLGIDAPWLVTVVSLLLFLGMAWEWRVSLGKDAAVFQWAAALTLTVTNLIAPRTATTHYVALLPAMCILFAIWCTRWGRGGVWATAATLLAFGVGLWVLFVITVAGNIESPLMYLPVPIFCWVGLLWARWWVSHGARLPAFGSQAT